MDLPIQAPNTSERKPFNFLVALLVYISHPHYYILLPVHTGHVGPCAGFNQFPIGLGIYFWGGRSFGYLCMVNHIVSAEFGGGYMS